MKTNPKTKCIDEMRRRILTLDLQPGAMLDEVMLANEYGISRTPMREVIQRLNGDGYLVIEQNRGAKVAPMDFATMRQFFQAAPMIYAAISRLAAERCEANDAARLKEIQLAYRRSLADGLPSETSMRNHEFHEVIGEIAGSPYLIPSLQRLLVDHTRIAQTFYQSANDDDAVRISKAADQHDAMIEAMANHDPEQAVDLTLDHWALSRNNIERFVSPDPLEFELGEASHAV